MLQRNVNVTLKRCFSVVISIRRYFDPAGIFWQVFFSAVIFVCMYFVFAVILFGSYFFRQVFFFLQNCYFGRYFFAGIFLQVFWRQRYFRQGFGLSVLFGFNHLTKEDVLIHLLWTYIFFRVIYALALHLEGLAPKKLIIW